MKEEVDVQGSPSLIVRTASARNATLNRSCVRAQKMCERRDGRPGLSSRSLIGPERWRSFPHASSRSPFWDASSVVRGVTVCVVFVIHSRHQTLFMLLSSFTVDIRHCLCCFRLSYRPDITVPVDWA